MIQNVVDQLTRCGAEVVTNSILSDIHSSGHPSKQELRLVLKEGLTGQALPDNTAVIQLDTEVVPELEREGIARDFVRMVQARRKERNLDISDRITLAYRTESALVQAAIAEHQAYIMEQVLATALTNDVPADATTEELGDGSITFDVMKV